MKKLLKLKKQILPFTVVVLLLLISVGFLLGLPKAINLVGASSVAASNIPLNPVVAPQQISAEKLLELKGAMPPKNLGITPPNVAATAAEVVDLGSGNILYVKNSNVKLPIASTTKIMTAIVASEHFNQADILTVPDISDVIGSTMGLKVGEQLTFKSLLYGMMLNSGNDAAYTIARDYPGGMSNFIAEMNKKAVSMNLTNTHFDNPAGYDSPGHYSSAGDLAKIGALAAESSQLAYIFGTKDMTVASANSSLLHPLHNLNKLLGEEGVLGIKTGTTPEAKESFVGLVERDGHKLLTVVLGSEDRFGETGNLMNWAYRNYQWN